MDGYPYQPPLLSLQDMLNVSEEEEDDGWSSNPFNISHFFEPIVSPSKTPQQEVSGPPNTRTPGDKGCTTTRGDAFYDGGMDCSSFEGFYEQQKPEQDATCRYAASIGSGSHEPISTSSKANCGSGSEMGGLDLLTEVLAELPGSSSSVSNHDKKYEDRQQDRVPDKQSPSPRKAKKITSLPKPLINESTCTFARDERQRRVTDTCNQTTTPRLVEVNVDTSRKTQEIPANTHKLTQLRKTYRGDAINHLESLIGTLKRFSKTIQDWVENESLPFLEEYKERATLDNILFEMTDATTSSPACQHPLDVAHLITQAVVDHAKGDTFLRQLPSRRPILWRSSELLLLQKSILQSAIHQRKFLLQCRYTDLLTQMGFDAEDLEQLQSADSTLDSELLAMKSLVEQHRIDSRYPNSQSKQPIKIVQIRNDYKTGAPRVFSFPSPECLVKDKWKQLDKISKTTLLSTLKENDIDWLYVAKKMYNMDPRRKLHEEACKHAYLHYISPYVNNDHWQRDELIRLRDMREKYPNVSWENIAGRLGTNRTPFSCFVKYRLFCAPSKPHTSAVVNGFLRKIDTYLVQFRGNVCRTDYEMSKLREYTWKPTMLMHYCLKRYNQGLRRGVFSVLEDVLLLVIMEKYKRYLLAGDGTFEVISYALPWRYVTSWRHRFGRLMTGFYKKSWTLEDDRRLLKLVNEFGPKYKVIERSFPNKDRKQCRGRYVLLSGILQQITLEEYHMIYTQNRRNLDLKRLNQIALHLDVAIRSKRSGTGKYVREFDLEFLKMRTPPTDNALESYLMTFPVSILQATLNRLCDCLLRILEKCDELSVSFDIEKVQKTDRRRFDPKCPVSVASALHLRHAKLVPVELLGNLTPFEKNVHAYYKHFCVMGTGKKKVKRPGVPTVDLLQKLPSVKRLIEPPLSFPHQPVLVVTTDTVETEEATQEAEFYEELEERKKGGRRKGKQRKIREDRIRAAKLRWAKSRNKLEEMEINVPESPCYSDVVSSPPASVGSVSIAGSDCGGGHAVRQAVVGVICDHAYISSSVEPSHLPGLSLPQLFAKLAQQPQFRGPGYEDSDQLKND